MALPQQAYKDRQFLAVIGDEVGISSLFTFAPAGEGSGAVGVGGLGVVDGEVMEIGV